MSPRSANGAKSCGTGQIGQICRPYPRPGQAEVAFAAPFRGRTLKGFPLGVSASEIRARVKARLSIDHLVTPAVAEAIRNYHLYL